MSTVSALPAISCIIGFVSLTYLLNLLRDTKSFEKLYNWWTNAELRELEEFERRDARETYRSTFSHSEKQKLVRLTTRYEKEAIMRDIQDQKQTLRITQNQQCMSIVQQIEYQYEKSERVSMERMLQRKATELKIKEMYIKQKISKCKKREEKIEKKELNHEVKQVKMELAKESEILTAFLETESEIKPLEIEIKSKPKSKTKSKVKSELEPQQKIRKLKNKKKVFSPFAVIDIQNHKIQKPKITVEMNEIPNIIHDESSCEENSHEIHQTTEFEDLLYLGTLAKNSSGETATIKISDKISDQIHEIELDNCDVQDNPLLKENASLQADIELLQTERTSLKSQVNLLLDSNRILTDSLVNAQNLAKEKISISDVEIMVKSKVEEQVQLLEIEKDLCIYESQSKLKNLEESLQRECEININHVIDKLMLEKKVESLDSKIKLDQETIKMLEQMLEDRHNKLSICEMEHESAKELIASLESGIQNIDRDHKSIQNENAQLNESVKNLEYQLSESNNIKNTLTELSKGLRLLLDEKIIKLQEAEISLSNTEKLCNNLEGKNSEYYQRIDLLEKDILQKSINSSQETKEAIAEKDLEIKSLKEETIQEMKIWKFRVRELEQMLSKETEKTKVLIAELDTFKSGSESGSIQGFERVLEKHSRKSSSSTLICE